MAAAFAFLAAAVLGLADSCAPGVSPSGTTAPAARVTVHGFKDRIGNLRIVIYPATDADFLAPARYVQRLDTKVTPEGEMTVCAPVPAAGDHVVVALHDRDSNGKLSPLRDGAGFSRNPRLGLSKPKVHTVKVRLDGITPLRIELNYLQGLRVAPVSPRNLRAGPAQSQQTR
jgi:uncharacterized protein (DUF2141 family)